MSEPNPPALPRIGRLTRRYPLLVSAMAAALVAIFVPFQDPPNRIADRLLVVEAAALAILTGVAVCSRRPPAAPANQLAEPQPRCQSRGAAILLCGILALWFVQWWPRFASARIADDDLIYIRDSADWHTAVDNLLMPYNEHFVAPARVWTWLLAAHASEAVRPRLLVAGSAVLFVATCILIYFVVQREWQAPGLGVLAVIVFSLTTSHREVIEWYAASLWLFPLDWILTGILVVQCRASEPGWPRLLTCSLVAALAPSSFWLGALAGPIASLYLWSRLPSSGIRNLCRCAAPTVAAIVGTLVLLSLRPESSAPEISLVQSSRVHPSEFDRAAVFAARFTVDRLLLTNLGVPLSWRTGRFAYPAWLGAFSGLTGYAIWRMGDRRGLAVGWAAVVLPYAIVFPFRAMIQYEMGLLVSTRYQLIPQFGVAWCVAALGASSKVLASRRLSAVSTVGLAALALIRFAIGMFQVAR